MTKRFLIVLLLTAGCTDNEDLSMQLRETPFRQLRGVHLGMTGRELHGARPQARYSPFLGLQEKLPDGNVVSYEFASALSDSANADIEPLDQLRGIYITQQHVSEEAAAAAWSTVTSAVSRDRRKPDSCERFPTGGVQARWFSGKAVVAIGAFPREPSVQHVGPRLMFGVSPLETMRQPDGGSPIPCPTKE